MIVARGSTEAVGLGRIGVVAGNVSELVPGSSVDAVVYPATFDAYFASEGTGVLAMTAMINEYTAACPESKIALIGYSQGGQVAMDVVCGTSETLFNVTADLSDALAKNVVAVVTFGDPSHMSGMPWNAGTSNNTGIFQRNNTAACEPYNPNIRAWCDTGDIYCDKGNNRTIHGTYFSYDHYVSQAAEFIVGRYNESLANSSSGAPTASGTATVSPTVSSTGGATATTAPPVVGQNAAGSFRAGGVGMAGIVAVVGVAFGLLL